MNDEDTSSGCSPEFPAAVLQPNDFPPPVYPDTPNFSINNTGLLHGQMPSISEAALQWRQPPFNMQKMETKLDPSFGLDSLLADYGMERLIAQIGTEGPRRCVKNRIEDKGQLIFGSPSSGSSSPPLTDSPLVEQAIDHGVDGNVASTQCTGCKTGEKASHFCTECDSLLCQRCTQAHQYMHCFSGHQLKRIDVNNSTSSLSGSPLNAASLDQSKPAPNCNVHQLAIRFYCYDCSQPVCQECTVSTHKDHQYQEAEKIVDVETENLRRLLNTVLEKCTGLNEYYEYIDQLNHRLGQSLLQAQMILNENVASVTAMIEAQRQAVMQELENFYAAHQLHLRNLDQNIQVMAERIATTADFTKRLLNHAVPTEIVVFKPILETRLNLFLAYEPDLTQINDMEFHVDRAADFANLRPTINNIIGKVRARPNGLPYPSMQSAMPTPIGRPSSRPANSLISENGIIGSSKSNYLPIGSGISIAGAQQQLLGSSAPTNGYNINMAFENAIPIRNASLGSLNGQFNGSLPSNEANSAGAARYERWSSALEPSHALGDSSESGELEKVAANGGLLPSRSQVRRYKMIYHCKFGEFGVLEGQFTEPSGVSVNAQNDIVVADTNNHRIQVFDKEGRFKFQFGECGKRDGQLLYPNRVAVNKQTGDYVVTERSPTHQIQVYNQYGQFLRKFGSNILQHPRGVCVDKKGRIIVVECKVMRVIIFDMFGNILQKFSCSKWLDFPNGVCANDNNEILISDNRAHCVKVFSYEGTYLRHYGGEGITNYPIGVGITSTGEVVVADNHNNFNLTVFSQDGVLIGALESKVKHAQCFDVALVDDCSVVLASKDYRLYLYRFSQLPATVSPH